jgi:colanic acid/amylovoran biosynthesis glycosyltransferase
MPKPAVLIFRNELLPRSETFVEAQARALRSFQPRFAGVHAARKSMTLPSSPILVDATSSFVGKLRRRLFWHASIAPKFNRELKEIAPCLLHAHFARDGAAALPISRLLAIPLVVTLHGYDVTSSDSWLARSIEGRVYLRRRELLWGRTTAFLCVSRFIRDKAIEKGFPQQKLIVHYTGIDTSLFGGAPRERDRDLIVFVGRLVEKKGCRYLLDALAIVRSQHPAVRLAIIGAGPLERELRERCRSENLPCEFLGVLSPSEVMEQLARARAFCVPSVTALNGDSEGLGMVFAEAQAMGTPVASFSHGGIPEVVLHGETGLLASERDSSALAANLLRLLVDDRLWAQLSARGPGWVREAFDLGRQTGHLEKIYADAVGRSLIYRGLGYDCEEEKRQPGRAPEVTKVSVHGVLKNRLLICSVQR